MDVALIDGWPGREGPSLARQMMEIITPQLRIGGIVINDNAEPDYLDYIRGSGQRLPLHVPAAQGRDGAVGEVVGAFAQVVFTRGFH